MRLAWRENEFFRDDYVAFEIHAQAAHFLSRALAFLCAKMTAAESRVTTQVVHFSAGSAQDAPYGKLSADA